MQSLAHLKNAARGERAPRRRPSAIVPSGVAAGRAASHATARACSSASSMSAHLCLTPWNCPIGRPNCSRTFAYSAAVSTHQAAPPAHSAAMSVTARSTTAVPCGSGRNAMDVAVDASTSATRLVASTLVRGVTLQSSALTTFQPPSAGTMISSASAAPSTGAAAPANATAAVVDPSASDGSSAAADVVVAELVDRRRCDHGRKERAWRTTATELFQHDRELAEPVTRAAQVLRERAGPSQPSVGELLPERRHRLVLGVEQGPRHCGRAMVRDPSARGVVQCDVVGGDPERHVRSAVPRPAATRRSTAPSSGSRRRRGGSCLLSRPRGR